MISSELAAEFVENYGPDAKVRWSQEEVEAQARFVREQTGGRHFVDWTTGEAGLQLMQSMWFGTAPGGTSGVSGVLAAGPLVELVEPASVFGMAGQTLQEGGKLVAIIPCLRDNSPESAEFMSLARAEMWPYYTVEELIEFLREAEFEIVQASFVSLPHFIDAVLHDRLQFKGFNRVLGKLQAQGYDPAEIGWGEVRLVSVRSGNVEQVES